MQLKLIDEKGKLFGKINLIDLLVVLVVVAVIAGVFWKLAGDKVTEAVAPAKNVTVKYEVLCTAQQTAAANAAAAVAIGQQLMSNGDLINGHIVDCAVEPYITTNVDAEGNSVAVTDQARSNLRFVLEATVSASDRTNSVGSQEVRIGRSHIVKTEQIEISGTVVSVEKTDG